MITNTLKKRIENTTNQGALENLLCQTVIEELINKVRCLENIIDENLKGERSSDPELLCYCLYDDIKLFKFLIDPFKDRSKEIEASLRAELEKDNLSF